MIINVLNPSDRNRENQTKETQKRGIEICRHNEELNRVHEEAMRILRELIKVQDEKRIAKEKEAAEPSAITPDLPISDSLIMEDEHLDTIPVTESANTIKSSVEDLVPTPSESADLSDGKREHYSLECPVSTISILHDQAQCGGSSQAQKAVNKIALRGCGNPFALSK
ncbi:hypothetical protein Tco_0840994 [Tanacetum coccineum]|uniref:Uncharacterized protein n=1 Tax=Tanacetum coccineum TaxID=301880 RepID=A0ABQ5AXU0_9ASTR